MAIPAVATELAPAKQVSRLIWLGLALAGLLYAGLAGFHVAFGLMNVDEGFYATAARAVWQGELPYRDFGYTQTPLLPYVNGALMKLTRFGLFEQRAINGLWALLALALGVRLLLRRGLAGRAVFLTMLFALTPSWQYFMHLGKTYGFTSLVVMAMVTVLWEWPAGWRKTAALAGLCVIGVGCRLPSAPFFGLLWLASWRDENGFNARQALRAGAALTVATLLLLLPFYLAAPALAKFWIFDFFRISVPIRDFHVRWQEFIAVGPVAWGLAAAVLVHGLARRRRWPWPETAVAVAALVALAMNLLPPGAYDEYGVPFLLPLAVAGLALLPAVPWSWPKAGALAVGLLAAQVAVIPALYSPFKAPGFRKSWSQWLPLSGTPYDFNLRVEIREARRAVADLLPRGEDFTGSAIILAVEADRPVPRRLRMGAFAVTADYSPAEADRLNLMTYPELSELFRAPGTKLIGLHGDNLFNYTWSVPSFRRQSAEERARWAADFSGLYQTAYKNWEFNVLVRR